MASKTAAPSPEYKWVNTPPNELNCVICRDVAMDPYQHGSEEGCGKIFCETCIMKHHNTSKKCPHCRNPLCTNTFKDKNCKHMH